MNRNMLIAVFVFAMLAVGFVGLMAKGDHRTDRNVPGATTGQGKSSVMD